ncbi:hypothetical protein GAY33_36170, partial [Azospirillum brasilense]|nr:hypothetical protein [Azospirillum argentinense]
MTPIRPTAVFLPVAVALAALALGACAPDVHDEMPGRAQAAPPVSAQGGGLKTLRQIQAEENARPTPAPRPEPAPAPPQKLSDASQTPNQPPPVRRRGRSSPPPPPTVQPATPALLE